MPAIELTASDGHTLNAYLSEPDTTPVGGIVVVQEIFGVNAHIRAVADRLAAAGYRCIAPALFDRVRPGVELAYDAEGTEVGRDLAWNLPLDDSLLDLGAAADNLAGDVGGTANVGVVGFCYGGMLAAAAASRDGHRFGAAVAYYPSMAAQILGADQPHIPLMVHLGDQDQRVTPADGQALATRWPDAVFHRYPAGHGFNCDLRPGYDESSSTLAGERTLQFFEANLTRES